MRAAARCIRAGLNQRFEFGSMDVGCRVLGDASRPCGCMLEADAAHPHHRRTGCSRCGGLVLLPVLTDSATSIADIQGGGGDKGGWADGRASVGAAEAPIKEATERFPPAPFSSCPNS